MTTNPSNDEHQRNNRKETNMSTDSIEARLDKINANATRARIDAALAAAPPEPAPDTLDRADQALSTALWKRAEAAARFASPTARRRAALELEARLLRAKIIGPNDRVSYDHRGKFTIAGPGPGIVHSSATGRILEVR